MEQVAVSEQHAAENSASVDSEVKDEAHPPITISTEVMEELIQMGFDKEIAEKALTNCHVQTVETAIEWINTFEVKEESSGEGTKYKEGTVVKPMLTKEEALVKAYELQKKLREERIEREKKEEYEREKNRIASTKQALDQQRLHEEQERKRSIMQLQIEKKAHDEERKRQRELLKREWEERFGPDVKYEPTTVNKYDKMSGKDKVIYWIVKLKKQYKDRDVEGLKKCLNLLRKYAQNIIDDPPNSKLHAIRKTNPTFATKVLPYEGSLDLLNIVGFVDDGADNLKITDGKADIFLFTQMVKFIDLTLREL